MCNDVCATLLLTIVAIGFADKSAGGRFSEEFEEASQKLQEYCGLLNIEVNERTAILEMIIECTDEQKQIYSKVQTVYEVLRVNFFHLLIHVSYRNTNSCLIMLKSS